MATSETEPARYLEQAEQIYSAQEVSRCIAGLANQLNQDYRDTSPVVLCVMGGGVIFTGQLVPQLTFPLSLDYVHASRYQGETTGGALTWKVRPSENIKDRSVLILDDILDEGLTLKAIVEECMQLGAIEVKTAVLVNKMLPHDKPIIADYIGLHVPDRYVFGCGMDIYGWWRNLAAIYALKE